MTDSPVMDSPVALIDGREVELRPMLPTDEARLVRFHESLSPETIRSRFFSTHPHLSPAEVYRFTHVDHTDREAIVAVIDDDIVAVARYDREPPGESAEVAFVVTDAWQGRGLGRLLFAALADRARAAGLRRITAQTFADNRRMYAVFAHAGLPMAHRYDDGIVSVELALEPTRMAP